MNEEDFEGSLILEMLADQNLIDDFYEAIDSDNIPKAMALMRKANVDEKTIVIAMRKMRESDGKH